MALTVGLTGCGDPYFTGHNLDGTTWESVKVTDSSKMEGGQAKITYTETTARLVFGANTVTIKELKRTQTLTKPGIDPDPKGWDREELTDADFASIGSSYSYNYNDFTGRIGNFSIKVKEIEDDGTTSVTDKEEVRSFTVDGSARTLSYDGKTYNFKK
ncbi:hypothetical protein FACS1894172_10040 [Spirochaetia bacterium]|nr:hypothetical protein FACS1894172_10040 [Spirochaetia bacterium]